MKLVKVSKGIKGIRDYRYYKLIDGKKVEISNVDYIEMQVLEGNTIEKDSDFNQSNRNTGLMFDPTKSSQVIKAEKKLKSIGRKMVKKPNRINKLAGKLIRLCNEIKSIQSLIDKQDYKYTVTDLQFDLIKLNNQKTKYSKKLSKLIYKKQASNEDEIKYNQKNQWYRKTNYYLNTIKREMKIEKEKKNNPLFPFNTKMNIEQKRYYMKEYLGIRI